MLKNVGFLNQKREVLRKIKLPIVKKRMFDIHKDIWSLGSPFILLIIHIHFDIVLTFQIEPKQGNVENVNRFKQERVALQEQEESIILQVSELYSK